MPKMNRGNAQYIVGIRLQRGYNRYKAALEAINEMPFTSVNDSEQLRHTIKTIQHIAEQALKVNDNEQS